MQPSKNLTISDEVSSIEYYKYSKILFHGYVAPFLLSYAIFFPVWIFNGFFNYFELGCVFLAVLGMIQVLVCLACHWSVHICAALTCKKVTHVQFADRVKVIPTQNNGYPELVPIQREKDESNKDVVSFIFQRICYIYDFEERNTFLPITYPISEQFSYYQNSKGYQEEEDVKVVQRKFGYNKIEMKVPAFMELFKERATAPFFVFQVFCVGLWCLDEYWYYSLFTLFMLVTFEATLVHQQQRNMKEIDNMGSKAYQIHVYRYRKWRAISSEELLPGDICSIVRSKCDVMVPCDMLLLRGSCIVDESMLTGEAVPQMKEPIESNPGNDILNIEDHSKLHILSGGTKVVNHTPPSKTMAGLKSPDNGCIGYVLKTGFSTSQGKLLKTILYGVKRVTANNLETLLFIGFLLIFAIAAASYVWIKGTADPRRNRYKLFLECTLILTSVVPPELPIELSLAVNSSLIALTKLGVFCTEPFRIPFAGKVDVVCFDKTGTLTSDDLVIEGVAGVNGDQKIVPVSDIPTSTVHVLACCHSLTYVDETLVGDPMEKAALNAINWTLSKGDLCMSRKGLRQSLKIDHRFHFTSNLKRMSVIASVHSADSSATNYIVAVKGAPETLHGMFISVPEFYDSLHKKLTCNGGRIMALGHKDLGSISPKEVREMKREDVESNLIFDGFIVLSCPLKLDSKSTIAEIQNASHYTIMITGDNPLTACHVANSLKMNNKTLLVLLKETTFVDKHASEVWCWKTVDESERFSLDVLTKILIDKYSFCLTGEAIQYMQLSPFLRQKFREILIHCRVFARVSPKQKEFIIHEFKDLGFVTLMCGDGTNDVGALRHAHVGVALLPGTAERMPPAKKTSKKKKDAAEESKAVPSSKGMSKAAKIRSVARGDVSVLTKTPLEEQQAKLREMLQEIDKESSQVVKLGDASIASPFTSRYCTPYSICHVIKQGRCTLVTTLQMFKILALNALILAYSQSALYLEGIKFSDGQATLQGILLAGCFLFISRSKPLVTLSKERPLPNIFNLYTILTVLLQFGVHFSSLYFVVNEAYVFSPKKEEYVDLEKKFEPNVINSVVYIISMSMQLSTFAINYKGRPFMEDLVENRPLFYSLCVSAGSLFILLMGWIPDISNQFQIVDLPEQFRMTFCRVVIIDLVSAWLVDRILRYLFGSSKLKTC
ncbi:endoplasmic reticulum transmembrane helix translocase isoform X2 [Hydra vulgaris]|uniref:Endoplasmic reticulum transmembrane helix translocase isoform X2 n=1 Tax=Hydra vulgaris TaxID=6087 RepID=A0ABM4BEB0_HYDVU